MKQALIWGALGLGLVSMSNATAAEHRSAAVAREFQREHPCPSTGLPFGSCPGYVKDHVVPLACGGADDPSNAASTEAHRPGLPASGGPARC
jgi:hypothetical protein